MSSENGFTSMTEHLNPLCCARKVQDSDVEFSLLRNQMGTYLNDDRFRMNLLCNFLFTKAYRLAVLVFFYSLLLRYYY